MGLHHHPHGHTHGHGDHAHDDDRRSQARSLALTLGLTGTIFVVEVVGGILSGSLALLSDAGHMLGDLSAVVLSLLAIRLGARAADRRRTFGYYRLEILAALANGLLLLFIAGSVLYEAFERFQSPPEVDTPLMLTVAVIGLAANGVSLVLLNRNRESLNVRSVFLHVLGDTLSSVGVVAGGIVILITGNVLVDPILSCLIGVIITVGAVSLVRESAHILLESVPSNIDLDEVAHGITHVPGVEAVHDLHIWCISSGKIALSAHIVVHSESDMKRNDRILHAVETLLMSEHKISHTTLQIETHSYEHVGEVH
jgi:cobalt-zinc-cadmium efflux system protein